MYYLKKNNIFNLLFYKMPQPLKLYPNCYCHYALSSAPTSALVAVKTNLK